MTGIDQRFPSAAAERNHTTAVDALLALTGSQDRAAADRVVTAIAAYVMRDYADRLKKEKYRK